MKIIGIFLLLLRDTLPSNHNPTSNTISRLNKRNKPPIYLAKFLRSKLQIIPSKYSCTWQKVKPSLAPRMMRKYFHVNINPIECDVFMIQGFPVAAMIYKNESNTILVEAFHLNIGLLILFDRSKYMRSELYQRYTNIETKHATNAHIFHTFESSFFVNDS